MDNVVKIIDYAEKRCHKSGARLTDKRKMVLTCLINSSKALSAYEIIEACKNDFNQSMAAMSIYRILTFLEQEGLVHKLSLANKYTLCSHIACDHEHRVSQFLICDQCGNVKEIDIGQDFLDNLKQRVTEVGYKLKTSQMELHCFCENCQ